MAIVERNDRPYRYRSIRRNGRVTSEYLGSGMAAILLGILDEEAREERDEQRQAVAAEREAIETLEHNLDALCLKARNLAAEALTAAGYHQHARGHWRKRRG